MFFFFNDTATTEIYTLSLHDALPICYGAIALDPHCDDRGRGDELDQLLEKGLLAVLGVMLLGEFATNVQDRKSTRLNSSHANISYAVFCLKKKKTLNSSPYF